MIRKAESFLAYLNLEFSNKSVFFAVFKNAFITSSLLEEQVNLRKKVIDHIGKLWI